MTALSAKVPVPSHVRPELVFDFDVFHDPRVEKDLFPGFKSLHGVAPDIFYTPRNGGHWMVTRYDYISHVMRDSEHFSNRNMTLPKFDSPYVMIPLNLDPPEHTPYRTILMRYFSGRVLIELESAIRQWSVRLIEKVRPHGHCDFMEAVATPFPVSIFMEMMGLPLERFDEFRAIVTEYFGLMTTERRLQLEGWIFAEMKKLIEARRVNREKDLISRLLDEEINGRRLTLEELQSMCFLMFIAGMDTVANQLAFTFRHLGGDRKLQDRLIADPAAIPNFVEEALRCFGIVNGARMCKKDYDYAGVHFRDGDMVISSLPLGGLDERKNAHPEVFDIDRKDRSHVTFSIGPHVCAGNSLARLEMRILTEEWAKRIGHFHIAPGYKPEFRSGLVMALKNLPVEWSSK